MDLDLDIKNIKKEYKQRINQKIADCKLLWDLFIDALKLEFVRDLNDISQYGISIEYKLEAQLWEAFSKITFYGCSPKEFLYLQYAIIMEQRVMITDGVITLTKAEAQAKNYAINKLKKLVYFKLILHRDNKIHYLKAHCIQDIQNDRYRFYG